MVASPVDLRRDHDAREGPNDVGCLRFSGWQANVQLDHA
jgi:hypothetical protein